MVYARTVVCSVNGIYVPSSLCSRLMLQGHYFLQMSGHPSSLYASTELLSSIEASFAELPDLDIPGVPQVQCSPLAPSVQLHRHA